MSKERTKIDDLIELAAQKVAKTASTYFTKSAVVNEVLSNSPLAKCLADIRTRYGPWGFYQFIIRRIYDRVGQVLQQRDTKEFRVYECYKIAHEREWRWIALRAMTADKLRIVIQQTRAQARQLNRKGEGYQIFLEELEKLRQPNATVNEIYERAVPKIRR